MLKEKGEATEGMQSRAVEAIEAKLKDLREFGGKTGETAIPLYEEMLEQIHEGNEKVLAEAVKKFGLKEIEMGSQALSSENMQPRELSKDEVEKIEEQLDRHN